jgi:hypothetical protein
MKVLIIPDVHNRWEIAEGIIKRNKDCEKVIFLGDYFDDFGDDPHIIANVADWFHYSVNQPNRIHICGNHDIHYWFKDNKMVRCSGYSQPKSIAINDFVTSNDWKKLVFYYNLDDTYILSHAGVHPFWLDQASFQKDEKISLDAKKVSKILERESESFLLAIGREKWHWFGVPGFSRCNGSPYYGGIVWLDWNGEFWPIRGLNQIVGHTPSYQLTWKFLTEGDSVNHTAGLGVVPKLSPESSYNICLDSNPGSRYYAIYEDGKFTVHEDTEFVVRSHQTVRRD